MHTCGLVGCANYLFTFLSPKDFVRNTITWLEKEAKPLFNSRYASNMSIFDVFIGILHELLIL